MDPFTLFFAQLFGVVALFMGVTTLFRRPHYRKVVQHLYKDDALLYVTGIFVLFLGVAIVLVHNLWETPAQIIVSLIGWAAIAEGACYLLFPDQMYAFAKKLLNKNMYYFFTVFSLLIGAYLTYQGFFA